MEEPSLSNNEWHQEVAKMPPIKWWDITNYIMRTASPYTQFTVKNLKANDDYDFFAKGHALDVNMNDIGD